MQEMQRGLVGLGIRLTPSELSSVCQQRHSFQHSFVPDPHSVRHLEESQQTECGDGGGGGEAAAAEAGPQMQVKELCFVFALRNGRKDRAWADQVW